jgi:hypothetical protein
MILMKWIKISLARPWLFQPGDPPLNLFKGVHSSSKAKSKEERELKKHLGGIIRLKAAGF